MKKNKMLRFACVLAIVTVLSTCVISGTFAKYTTTVSSTDKARVATWGWQDTAIDLSNLFKNAYIAKEVANLDAIGDVNVVAPGTTNSASFSFTFDGEQEAPEVAYNLKVELNESVVATDIKENKNIQWKLSGGEIASPVWGTWSNLVDKVHELSGDASGSKDYAPGTLPAAFDNGEVYTISWQWVFDDVSYVLKTGKYLTASDFYNAAGYALYNKISDGIYASLKDGVEIGNDKVESLADATIITDLTVGDFIKEDEFYSDAYIADNTIYEAGKTVTSTVYDDQLTEDGKAKVAKYQVKTGKTLESTDFVSGYTADIVAGTKISEATYATLQEGKVGKEKVDTTVPSAKKLLSGYYLTADDFMSATAYLSYSAIADDVYARLNVSGIDKVEKTGTEKTYYITTSALTKDDYADSAYIQNVAVDTIISEAVYNALKTGIEGKEKVTQTDSVYVIAAGKELLPTDFKDYNGTSSATYTAIKNGVLEHGKYIESSTYALLNATGKAKIASNASYELSSDLEASDFADYTTTSAILTAIQSNSAIASFTNGYVTSTQYAQLNTSGQDKIDSTSPVYNMVVKAITADDYANEPGPTFDPGDTFTIQPGNPLTDDGLKKVAVCYPIKSGKTLVEEDCPDYHISANYNAYAGGGKNLNATVISQLNDTGKAKVLVKGLSYVSSLEVTDFTDAVSNIASYSGEYISEALYNGLDTSGREKYDGTASYRVKAGESIDGSESSTDLLNPPGTYYSAGDIIGYGTWETDLSDTGKAKCEAVYKLSDTGNPVVEADLLPSQYTSAAYQSFVDLGNKLTAFSYGKLNATGLGRFMPEYLRLSYSLEMEDFADVVYTSVTYDNAVSGDASALNAGKTTNATIYAQLTTEGKTKVNGTTYAVSTTLHAGDFIDRTVSSSANYEAVTKAPFQAGKDVSKATYDALRAGVQTEKFDSAQEKKFYTVNTAIEQTDFADYDVTDRMSDDYFEIFLAVGKTITETQYAQIKAANQSKVTITYDKQYVINTALTSGDFSNVADYNALITSALAQNAVISADVYDALKVANVNGQQKVKTLKQDELDTYMANKADLDEIKFVLTITATQLDEYTTPAD